MSRHRTSPELLFTSLFRNLSCTPNALILYPCQVCLPKRESTMMLLHICANLILKIATFCKHVTPDRSLTKEIFSLLDADINFKLSSSPPSTPTQTNISTNPTRNSSFGFGSFLGKRPTARIPSQPTATQPTRSNSSRFDYAGPRFTLHPADAGPGTAGHPDCYKVR